MKHEQAKKVADDALKALSAHLQQGRSDGLKAYLAAMARFHQYSFGNIMLIASQQPEATHVAGYRAWQKLGRQVRKGEKAIVIIAPVVRKRQDDEPRQDGDSDRYVAGFRAAHVFDIAQTEGEALPEIRSVNGSTNGYLDKLKHAVTQQNITLEYDENLHAEGLSKGGCIVLRAGLNEAEEFATLAHELAHEMLHKRDQGPRPPKVVRETEAEAVAFVVCQAIGLDATRAAADYIQLYRGDHETLAASLDSIQKTASAIIEAVTEADATPPHQS